MTPHRSARRRGFTLLEIMLVLVITGILVAAIAAAIHIHLRVSEVGRSEVEQAQLARVVLRRIGDDLRAAVPYVEPIESDAGATSAEVDAAIASATAALGGTGGSTASTGGASSGGGTSSGGSSSGGRSSGSTSSGGTSSSSGGSSGSGAQTLQPLGKLSTLKPQSASSSSSSGSSGGGSSSSGSSGSSSGGGSSGSSSSSGSSTNKNSSTGSDTETSDATATIAKPGIYGDQYSLQVDVSRAPRTEIALPTAGLDAPGDVKTVGYYIAPVPGATDAAGQPVMGLYRRSFDKAVAAFDASAGTTAGTAAQLLAEEVAAIEFRYFDGTAWQTSWDSSGGTLPVAVEVAITTLTHSNNPSGMITVPQVHRLTVAIPAAQSGSSSTSTDADATSSSSTGSTP